MFRCPHRACAHRFPPLPRRRCSLCLLRPWPQCNAPPLVFRPGERLGLAVGGLWDGVGATARVARRPITAQALPHVLLIFRARVGSFSWKCLRLRGRARVSLRKRTPLLPPLFCHPSLSPFSCIWHSACGSIGPGDAQHAGRQPSACAGQRWRTASRYREVTCSPQLLDQQGCCASWWAGPPRGLPRRPRACPCRSSKSSHELQLPLRGGATLPRSRLRPFSTCGGAEGVLHGLPPAGPLRPTPYRCRRGHIPKSQGASTALVRRFPGDWSHPPRPPEKDTGMGGCGPQQRGGHHGPHRSWFESAFRSNPV